MTQRQTVEDYLARHHPDCDPQAYEKEVVRLATTLLCQAERETHAYRLAALLFYGLGAVWTVVMLVIGWVDYWTVLGLLVTVVACRTGLVALLRLYDDGPCIGLVLAPADPVTLNRYAQSEWITVFDSVCDYGHDLGWDVKGHVTVGRLLDDWARHTRCNRLSYWAL